MNRRTFLRALAALPLLRFLSLPPVAAEVPAAMIPVLPTGGLVASGFISRVDFSSALLASLKMEELFIGHLDAAWETDPIAYWVEDALS